MSECVNTATIKQFSTRFTVKPIANWFLPLSLCEQGTCIKWLVLLQNSIKNIIKMYVHVVYLENYYNTI